MSGKTTNRVNTTNDEAAARSLVRTFGLFDRAMHPYFSSFGITSSQWGVMRVLQRAELEGDTGLRLTELSQRLLVRPPSISGIVDRMQREGLVVRVQSADDLRARSVELTPRGKQLLQKVSVGHQQHLRKLLRPLKAQERKTLDRLLDRWGLHLQRLSDEPAALAVE